MCGIFSIYSKEIIKPSYFLQSLRELEYRGYDSAGVAYFQKDNLNIVKTVSKIKDLEIKLKKNINTSLIIGHTRWATHGKPSIKNCHPHNYKDIVLVHNGIVENYDELKSSNILKRNKFKSETDTEILAHLISYYLKKEGSLAKAVFKVGKIIKGSNAFLCVHKDIPDLLIAYKNKTPLYFGIRKNDQYLFSSDTNAMKNNLDKYYYFNNEEIIEIKDNNFKCFDKNMKIKNIKMASYKESSNNEVMNKEENKSITYNEIRSQRLLIPKTFNAFNKIKKYLTKINKPSEIVIIGCGSSFNAGMLGKYYFEQISKIPTHVYSPSDFNYFHKNNSKVLYIFISQSGETADTCNLLESNAKFFKNSISIVNNSYSRIVKNTKYNLNLNLGIEKGVAATKTFTVELLFLYFLSIIFSKNYHRIKYSNFKKNFTKLFNLEKNIKKIAKNFYKSNNIFILGRNYTYPVALEAALKIKEISYIHAEAALSSEMKHGPIALLEPNFPVIYLLSNDNESILKEITNMYETSTRTNKILLLSTAENLKKIEKKFLKKIKYIEIPNVEEYFLPIMFTVPLQYLSYYLANLKNLPIDQPRNLAKVVTVV